MQQWKGDRYVRDGELKWSDVLNQQQMEKLITNETYLGIYASLFR